MQGRIAYGDLYYEPTHEVNLSRLVPSEVVQERAGRRRQDIVARRLVGNLWLFLGVYSRGMLSVGLIAPCPIDTTAQVEYGSSRMSSRRKNEPGGVGFPLMSLRNLVEWPQEALSQALSNTDEGTFQEIISYAQLREGKQWRHTVPHPPIR